jgi:hypothetical protein
VNPFGSASTKKSRPSFEDPMMMKSITLIRPFSPAQRRRAKLLGNHAEARNPTPYPRHYKNNPQ